MYNFFYTPGIVWNKTEINDSYYQPLWVNNTKYSMVVALSHYRTFSLASLSHTDILYNKSSLHYPNSLETMELSYNLTPSLINEDLWDLLISGKVIYLHICLTPKGSKHTKYFAYPLTTKQKIKYDESRFLLKRNNTNIISNKILTPVTHFIPKLPISIVIDQPYINPNQIPVIIYNKISLIKRKFYDMFIFTSKYLISNKEFIPLNETVDTIPITIKFNKISLLKYEILSLIENSFELFDKIGDDKDMEEIRSIFTELNPLLLSATLLVSFLHLLFDILAFENEWKFWRKQRFFNNYSTHTLLLNIICEVVIILYLYDQGTPFIFILPDVLSVGFELWKLRLIQSNSSKNNKTEIIKNISSESFIILISIALPILLSYGGYTLINNKYNSWYSWIIQTLTSFVYAFGFMMMTPQLFLNYKLKTVPNLPWVSLGYRFFNTIIDDFFAFIIHVPTLHRISCFRDDIVFVLYLYQRHIYPVDKNRVEDDRKIIKDEKKKNE